MNKEELLKMASDAGLSYLDGAGKNEYGHCIDDEIKAFANAILERAAVEFNQPHAEYFGHEIQETIRALKTENSV